MMRWAPPPPSYLDEVGASLLTADVELLLWRLECQQLLGDADVALQDGLLHPGLTCPLHLVLAIHTLINSGPGHSGITMLHFWVPK